MSENNFELVLAKATNLPTVKIDRSTYLRKELRRYCDNKTLTLAVSHNPAYAGIPVSIIHEIAEKSIKYETGKVTALSAAAGMPGGFAMIGTIPADITQYTAHLLRILQKLVYLYGWDDIIDENGFDDETNGLLTLFIGIMFGVSAAGTSVTKLSTVIAKNASTKLAKKALTKTAYYPIVKNVAKAIGVKMTKEIFAKNVSKIIPIIGAAASGGITYATFKPMTKRLEKHLASLPLCDVDHYIQQRAEQKK